MGKFKIILWIWIFPLFSALDFLVQKIKEQEIKKKFCRSLPYFSIYPEVQPLVPTLFIALFFHFCPLCAKITKYNNFLKVNITVRRVRNSMKLKTGWIWYEITNEAVFQDLLLLWVNPIFKNEFSTW